MQALIGWLHVTTASNSSQDIGKETADAMNTTIASITTVTATFGIK
jgi:hypothetical protein